MITDRERYLMRSAMTSGCNYKDLDDWLDQSADMDGRDDTVGQLLSDDADTYNRLCRNKKTPRGGGLDLTK